MKRIRLKFETGLARYVNNKLLQFLFRISYISYLFVGGKYHECSNMPILVYLFAAIFSAYTAVQCLIALIKNEKSKTFNMPSNNILMGLLFGKNNVDWVNNLKGFVLWTIGTIFFIAAFLKKL